jgi:hypothetical protein
MRLTKIVSWRPENTKAVYQRFEGLMKGEAPEDVKQAYSKLKIVAWEKLAANKVLMVLEGDDISVQLWTDYWSDLATEELMMPSHDLTEQEVVAKITPPAFLRQ